MQPAVSDLHCAGSVGVTEDREPFPDGGAVQFVEGGFPALSLEPAGEDVTAWLYSLRVFGERPSARR